MRFGADDDRSMLSYLQERRMNYFREVFPERYTILNSKEYQDRDPIWPVMGR